VVMRRKGPGGPSGARGHGELEPSGGNAWGGGREGLERRTPGSAQPGLGPRFQRRSDDKIREEIWELLSNNADLDPSEVEVLVEGGEVTLTGTVDSRDARWLTEDLVTSVSGVREVYNQLKVAR
jgi:osmotically-inducible protein OsmY